MTYLYLSPNPFSYEEAIFFVGLRVRFVSDTKTTRFVNFELHEAFFKAGQVVTVRAVHDYGQGCLLAIYEGDDFVRPFDKDDFFLYFLPVGFVSLSSEC